MGELKLWSNLFVLFALPFTFQILNFIYFYYTWYIFFLLHFVRTLDLEPLWAAGIQTSDVSSSYLSVFLNHCSDCRLIVNAQLELLYPCEAIFFLSSGLNFGCKTLWRWHQDKPYETDILIIQCVVWLIVFV